MIKFLAIYVLLFLSGVIRNQDFPKGDLTIPQFKRIIRNMQDREKLSSCVFSVNGYFVSERRPMLITDLALMRTNSLLPDSLYLSLSGEGIDSIRNLTSKYQGAYLKLKLRIVDGQIKVKERPIILKGDR